MTLAFSYPVVYCILVLPLSVGRWIEFHQERTGTKQNRVPSRATLAVSAVFSLTGIADVLLFFATRRGLLLFDDDDPPPAIQVCASCSGGGVPMNAVESSRSEFGNPVGQGVQLDAVDDRLNHGVSLRRNLFCWCDCNLFATLLSNRDRVRETNRVIS